MIHEALSTYICICFSMTKKFVFTGRFENLYLKIISRVAVDFHIQLYNNKNLKNG